MLFHKLRLALVLMTFILGVLLHLKLGFMEAWYLYLASFVFLLTHFLFGTVKTAMSFLQRGDTLKAAVLLQQIKRPEWLLKSHKAQYYFAKGLIALQNKELELGKEFLVQSLQIGLYKDKEKALANINLAHITFLQKEIDAAQQFLKKAKEFAANDLMVKDNIEKMEKILSANK